MFVVAAQSSPCQPVRLVETRCHILRQLYWELGWWGDAVPGSPCWQLASAVCAVEMCMSVDSVIGLLFQCSHISPWTRSPIR